MIANLTTRILPALLAAALTSCSQPAPPAKGAARPDSLAQADAKTLAIVASIRAAGTQFVSSVEVKPLRDPAVDGLLKQAHDLEGQQQIAAAIDAVNKALKIAPNAPDILQYEAELQIQAHDWKQAGALAQKSWELGPRVGALCARNQQTLVHVREAQGDAAGAAQAKQQLSGCKVPAPARY
ncbi:MAG TPA: tetratricopeptide repeat protein [Rudaea sp.]|jgi:tetratricopeptide (TPR) repeat protein